MITQNDLTCKISKRMSFCHNFVNITTEFIVLCGPSGSGKTTFARQLCKDYPHLFEQTISATTRSPRQGEINGEDYYFLSPEKFICLIERNNFLEHAIFGVHRYGTAIDEVSRICNNGKHPVMVLEKKGLLHLIELFGTQIIPVFVLPPHEEELRKRLIERGDPEEMIEKRLISGRTEADFALSYSELNKSIIFQNINFNTAYGELKDGIKKFLESNKLQDGCITEQKELRGKCFQKNS